MNETPFRKRAGVSGLSTRCLCRTYATRWHKSENELYTYVCILIVSHTHVVMYALKSRQCHKYTERKRLQPKKQPVYNF